MSGKVLTSDWEQVKAWLPEIRGLNPKDRGDMLATLDEPVRREIESLLDVEAEAGDFMTASAGGYSKGLIDGEDAAMTGRAVGAYRIVCELGSGGMGAVYLGERADEKFESRVAIKMLRREFNSAPVRRNFDREKSILARLEHPGIARLLDAGTADDGVPFLVMEYVDGMPVDDYCRRNELSIKDRLKLFTRICDAVGFAHRNLVIHRDLKPSNILVTKSGDVKLLDFGISKLLEANPAATSTITASRALTPIYASPEQIEGRNLTTAADVYSLGVVLYRMLTGKYPFELNEATNGDLIKILTESEPTPPSDLNSHLKGDIDNIVLKALSKEPERRYQTVEQMAADIWAHIDGKPVSARRPTISYRLSRFYRRNRIAVTAGILIGVTALTAAAFSFRQARVATAESDNARAEQAKSEKISKFMYRIISYANSLWYADGHKFEGKALVFDALVDLGDKIDAEFANEPDVAAELHHRFGEAIQAHVRNSSGERVKNDRLTFHFLRALELRKRAHGEYHELVAKDIFYGYWYLTENPDERAALLDQGINMMRSVNPRNRNFPFMLEDYAGRLIGDFPTDMRAALHRAVTPKTQESREEIAVRYMHEALPYAAEHYGENSVPVHQFNCILAYGLALQEKWDEMAQPKRICGDGSNGSGEIVVKRLRELIVEKGRQDLLDIR